MCGNLVILEVVETNFYDMPKCILITLILKKEIFSWSYKSCGKLQCGAMTPSYI